MEELHAASATLLGSSEGIDDRERPLVAHGQGRAVAVRGTRRARRRRRRSRSSTRTRGCGPRRDAAPPGRAENEGVSDAMGEQLAAARERFDGARRQLGAGDGALPRVRPADAGGRARGGGAERSRRRARRWRSFSPESAAGMIDLRIADVRLRARRPRRRARAGAARALAARPRPRRHRVRPGHAGPDRVARRGPRRGAQAELDRRARAAGRGAARRCPQRVTGTRSCEALIADAVAAETRRLRGRRRAPVGDPHRLALATRTCRCWPPWRCRRRRWPRRRGDRDGGGRAAGRRRPRCAGRRIATNPEIIRLGAGARGAAATREEPCRLEALLSRTAPVRA